MDVSLQCVNNIIMYCKEIKIYKNIGGGNSFLCIASAKIHMIVVYANPCLFYLFNIKKQCVNNNQIVLSLILMMY